ncbi:hypothetical protein ACU4GD_41655 [Cupriavidus basilensis]
MKEALGESSSCRRRSPGGLLPALTRTPLPAGPACAAFITRPAWRDFSVKLSLYRRSVDAALALRLTLFPRFRNVPDGPEVPGVQTPAAPASSPHEIRPGQSIELLKALHILTRDGKTEPG